MAKQLNLLEQERIIPTALHTEMERSYLEYAMSVIVGRALPDVRDGLKPVHRRILYAMHELGLTPDRPYRKCARVVGDVLGKYHPHGDQSVYDALVRMVQDFSSRYPLAAGHGNFGSIDNDPAAAMRYTETRLAPISHQALLAEIGEATVAYTNNFDNSQQEPVVLPAQLPLLLLNGCAGIAVGMATNIPPHNLGEVVDGLIALIDNPSLGDEELWQIIPGPDFPTGGEIIDRAGIYEAYRTGRGLIPVQGVASIEQIIQGKRRREKTAIVVTELPYQVNKAAWVEKVAELVNAGKIEGISDIRDESDRDGIRVVVELKRDINPEEILAHLYHQTALRSNFGAIFLALVDNKPCQLSLRELLQQFLDFREHTLTRRYRYELEQAQKRLHLVAGLLKALNNLDLAIEILRHAPDGTTAGLQLQERLQLSETQADAILAMPMRRLTGLERQKLQTELTELQERITQLELLLRDRQELLKSLKKDLRQLKRKFADPRRTRLLKVKSPSLSPGKSQKQEEESPQKEKEVVSAPKVQIPNDAVVEVTRKGTVVWLSPPTPPKVPKKTDDLIVFRSKVAGRSQFLVLTQSGKVYPVTLTDLPANNRPAPLLKFMPGSVQEKQEPFLSYFFAPNDLNAVSLLFLTKEGRLKRLAGTELLELTNRGATLIKLKDEDQLIYFGLAKEGDNVVIATSGGRILRLPVDEEQIPVMKRTAQGNQATRVRAGEQVIGCTIAKEKQDIICVTQLGYAKRLPVGTIRLGARGDIGTQVIQFTEKRDRLASVIPAPKETLFLVTNTGRLLPFPVKSVTTQGRDGSGDLLPQLREGETIVLATV